MTYWRRYRFLRMAFLRRHILYEVFGVLISIALIVMMWPQITYYARFVKYLLLFK